MTNSDFEYKYYNFGSFLMHFKVDDEFFSTLKNEVNTVYQNKIDMRLDLAGRIQEEYLFTEEQLALLSPTILNYIDRYMHELIAGWKEWNPSTYSLPFHKLFLEKMWVNFQKKLEYNPIHVHSGLLSFVLFVDVPEAIYSEKRNHNSTNNGYISFFEGPMQSLKSCDILDKEHHDIIELTNPVCQLDLKPVTGDILIFPANLSHAVAAFTSDVTRVSVSGNINYRYD